MLEFSYSRRIMELVPGATKPPSEAEVAAILCDRVNLAPDQFAKMDLRARLPFVKLAIEKAALQVRTATSSETTAPSKARKTRPSRRLDAATEARDEWIYRQCCALTPYDTIAIRLKKKPKSWVRIDSKQGIRAAAERYAKRHNLPPIPTRQSTE